MNKEYLTLQEFALKIGKSAQTIRRMIKKGEVKAQRMRTPQGFNYMIYCGNAVRSYDESPPERALSDNSTIQTPIQPAIQNTNYQVNNEMVISQSTVEDLCEADDDYYVIDKIEHSPSPIDFNRMLETHHREKMMLIHILESLQVELNRAKMPPPSIFKRILNWFV